MYVKQNINFFETGSCGRLDITIGPKQTMGKTVEGLMVTVHMPKTVLSVNLTVTQGNYTYEPTTKVTTFTMTYLLIRLLYTFMQDLRGVISSWCCGDIGEKYN